MEIMKLFNDILQKVTVNSKDDGRNFTCTTRIEAIKELLSESRYELLQEGYLTLVYGKRKPIAGESIVLISTHIDCVYSQCFCHDKGEMWQGTFDNSFTNAAALWNMLNDRFADNVIVAFTGDEEKDSAGALETAAILTEMNCNISYAIVLDVTNAGWDENANFTIENDYGFDIYTAHGLVELLKPHEEELVFCHDAEPDETSDYFYTYGIPCFTLCAPVKGDMHCDKGTLLRKSSFAPYTGIMSTIANNLTK